MSIFHLEQAVTSLFVSSNGSAGAIKAKPIKKCPGVSAATSSSQVLVGLIGLKFRQDSITIVTVENSLTISFELLITRTKCSNLAIALRTSCLKLDAAENKRPSSGSAPVKFLPLSLFMTRHNPLRANKTTKCSEESNKTDKN